MWNKIIDIVKMGAGKTPMDVVFWIGIGVIAFVLVLGIIRAILKRKMLPVCRHKFRLSQVVIWLYFVFAVFAVMTFNHGVTLGFDNVFVYMAYPIAVVLVSYLIVWLFSYTVRCKLKCTEWQDFTEKEERKPRKIKAERIKADKPEKEEIVFIKEEEPKTVTAAPVQTRHTSAPTPTPKQEDKGDEMKITVKDNKGKEVEVVLPEIEPMYQEVKSSTMGPLLDDKVDYDTERKIERISTLAEEIERRRQKNVKITDGDKENKFMAGVDHTDTMYTPDQDPKVVVRKITEQVKVEPKVEEAPKTGFTYQRITERREVENKTMAGSNTYGTTRTTATKSTSSAQDVLDAIARLRNSMNTKK